MIARGWLLLAIVILINLISINHFIRFDLTKENKFTISKSSQNVIERLDDIINVKVYLSKKLPPQINESAQYVKDMLSEYSAFSQGNIQVTYVDPAKNTDAMQEAQNIGIPQIQMEVLEQDKYQIQNGYFGIGIFYAGNTETIPVIQNLSTFEYDFTSKIKKVASQETKTIGFFNGSEEQDSQNSYSTVDQNLQKTYQTKIVNLADSENIDVDTLIITRKAEEIAPEEFVKIQNFLNQGGKVILLIDGVNVSQGLQAQAIDQTKVNEFLQNYGVTINSDLIYDQYHESASFSQGFMTFFLPYPLFPKLINENFDQNNQIVNTLKSVVTPWASSLSIEPKEGVTISKLLQTSKKADHLLENLNLNPQQQFTINTAQQFTIATLINENLLVVADSDFISDGFLQQFSQNLNFILNAVDYLTLDPDLIAIRSKIFTDNPLKKIAEELNIIIKTIGILFSPIILIIYGLVRMKGRQKMKNL
ncbi:hypothetical protein A2335_02105 [Candidatus Peregrinibacteria bacterium RIFOXYB2_FULL_32_7]|nr:MAG: hypothetical protein A2335_02105 [Candidatus Peregrinibacteria bacterium RIFOXYB2_FULL_32_7]